MAEGNSMPPNFKGPVWDRINMRNICDGHFSKLKGELESPTTT